MDWFEQIFHISPDGGNGSLEIGVIAGAAVALAMAIAGALKLGTLVRRWSGRATPEARKRETAR